MIHMLLAHGGQWVPEDKQAIRYDRQALLKMKREYTMEFIWLLREHQAARRADVEELVRTPSMKKLLEAEDVGGLLKGLPDSASQEGFAA